jgi:hypothetical protein
MRLGQHACRRQATAQKEHVGEETAAALALGGLLGHQYCSGVCGIDTLPLTIGEDGDGIGG